ncbi:MAG: hypothetical protein AMJ91_06105 [candidate division Zixibacteria bacterium SM23_73_3]|nr:MAG: hypothetical protein AMJ91_06105 [candidate division Zixibacteria bacterium SM23_73_3]
MECSPLGERCFIFSFEKFLIKLKLDNTQGFSLGSNPCPIWKEEMLMVYLMGGTFPPYFLKG